MTLGKFGSFMNMISPIGVSCIGGDLLDLWLLQVHKGRFYMELFRRLY
jgi:hypothetical protein